MHRLWALVVLTINAPSMEEVSFMRAGWIVVVVMVVAMAAPVWAAPQELSLTPELGAAIERLLAGPGSGADLDAAAVTTLVQMARDLPVGGEFALPRRKGLSGALSVFTVAVPFARVVPYAYHPDIPSYATMPSSIRLQEWTSEAVKAAMRQLVANLSQPRTVHGVEREVIVPNLDTGGYYEYLQERVIALVPVEGTMVLASVACQVQPSSVGRRGLVVGDDRQWNYLFSETVGLGGALGWVKSYMYEGCSLAFFIPEQEKTRVVSFKWLRAGWSGINMVRPSHILEGMRRFGTDFRSILESPSLPSLAETIGLAAKVRGLPQDRLAALAQGALTAMLPQVSDRQLSELVRDRQYLQNVPRDEWERLAFLEIWKCRLGRTSSLTSCLEPLASVYP